MRRRRLIERSSSDDERRADSRSCNIRYVRKRPSPTRNHSYERARPRPDEEGESRTRPRSWSRRRYSDIDDSDDDLVYKIDKKGHRRSRERSRRDPRGQDRHRGDQYCMSGALPAELNSGGSPTSRKHPRQGKQEKHECWSTRAGPLKISIADPRNERKGDESCRCRRCHRGRPGSRRDHESKRSRPGSRSSTSRPAHSRPSSARRSKLVGILKRRFSDETDRPRLRKTVSFENGTKVPCDHEGRRCSRSDEESRSRRSTRMGDEQMAYNRSLARKRDASPEQIHKSEENRRSWAGDEAGIREWNPERSPERRRGSSTSYDRESRVCKCRGTRQSSRSQSPEAVEGVSLNRERRPYAQAHNEARCKNCYHCPDSPECSKKDQKSPGVGPSRVSSTRPDRSEERVRSIAHSVLLSMHQFWCKGDCTDLPRFVKRMNGCSECRRRNPLAKRPSAGRSVPNCRTLIHCRKFGSEIFSGHGAVFPFDNDVDHTLRLGFAEVYCCHTISGYLTIEEYLVYRHQRIDDLDMGLWVRGQIFRTQVENVRRLGHDGLVVRVPGPESKFLAGLAEEIRRTDRLWKTIVERSRMDRRQGGETEVLRVLEDMVRNWAPTRVGRV